MPEEAALPFDLAHFHVVERLGQGGMGVVYRAEDTRLRRMVAIKLLPRELEKDPDRRERLLREARSAAAVTHPNVASVYEIGESGGRAFIVMELIDGKSLRQTLEAGRLGAADVLRFARGIARALSRAHEKGVVHRDLKPDNVMIDRDGEIKVLDFGLARFRDEAIGQGGEQSSTATALTREGAVLGTPGYMAPEQILGRPVDARADVFSFGVLLYEMATGVRPFRGSSPMEIAIQIERDDPERPSKLTRSVDANVERVIVRCLQKKPEARYGSGAEVLVALEGADPGVVRRAWGWSVFIAALGVVVGVAGIRGLANRHREPAPRASASAAPVTVPGMFDDDSPVTASREALADYRDALTSFHDGTGHHVELMLRALERDPDFAAAHLMVACFAEVDGLNLPGHYARAAALAPKLQGRERDLLDLLDPSLDGAGRRARVDTLLKRRPDDALLWFARALDDDRAGAERSLDRALALDPQFLPALARKAGLLERQDRDGARALLSHCIQEHPLAVTCIHQRALLLGEDGQCDLAAEDVRRWLGLQPESRPGLDLLANLLAAQGRPLEAVSDLLRQSSEAQDLGDGLEVFGLREVRLAHYRGDLGEAIRLATEALRRVEVSSSTEAHSQPSLQLVLDYTEIGDLGSAARVAMAWWTHHDAWRADGTTDYVGPMLAAAARGGAMSAAQARAQLEAHLSREHSNDDDDRAIWAISYAWPASTPAEARDALVRYDALKSPPHFVGYQGAIGRTLFLGGRPDEARPLLEKIAHGCVPLDNMVNVVHAHLYLGEIAEQKGDSTVACAELAEVLARWGAAKPRSVTADEARKHQATLQCPRK